MKKKLFTLLCFFLISCTNKVKREIDKNKMENMVQVKDSLFKADGKLILQEIESMNTMDQDIRLLKKYGTTDSSTIDSIDKSFERLGKNTEELQYFPKQTDIVFDSLFAITSRIHTKRLTNIIDKYGYPTSERLGDSVNAVNALVILLHPAKEYERQLMPLLEQELKLGRIDTNTVEMVKWNYRNRKGLPNLKGVTIIDKRPKADSEN